VSGAQERDVKLLLVDDDPIQRKLAVRRLQLAGHEVTIAEDGAQALELVRASPPEVVVSDVVMPNLDGFGLCEAMKADPALAAIPILLITNSSLEDADWFLARRAGARDMIVRTPDFADIIKALSAM
jgi:CheY-like chemotaxis protein